METTAHRETTMRKLEVDWVELEEAYSSHMSDFDELTFTHYLDRETGRVKCLSGSAFSAADGEDDRVGELYGWEPDGEEIELARQVLDNPERYLEVPSSETRDDYRAMEDFIDSVADDHLAELLAVAIEGRGAFSRFRGVLARYPEEKERWYAFKRRQDLAQLAAWLEVEGIEPTNSPPPRG